MTSWFEKTGVLQKTRELLAERSCEAYLVGGYVRDQLLGRETHDLDLAVEQEAIGLAREAADRLGGAFVLLDEERQTARVVLRDRGELYYIDFATLRGDSLQADLATRDFTINAMAVNAQDTGSPAQLLDFHGGQQDLDKGVVRAVSQTIFRDDPLRLLRVVRLAAELEMQADERTEELIVRDASVISLSSAERVRDELCRILRTGDAAASLRYLDQLGILTAVIPELEPLRGVEQPAPGHRSVLDLSLATVEALERIAALVDAVSGKGQQSWAERDRPKDEIWGHLGDVLIPFGEQIRAHLEKRIADQRSRLAVLKLAGLLHDLARATTSKLDEDGGIHDLGHQAAGAALAAGILRRLRFSKREVRLVRSVVHRHLRPLQLAQQEKITRRDVYRFFRDTRGMGVDVLLHSLADNVAARHPGQDVAEWRDLFDAVGLLLSKYYLQYEEVIAPPPVIRGNDLISRMAIEPGPVIGRLLEGVREAQAAGEVATKEEALRLAEALLASEHE